MDKVDLQELLKLARNRGQRPESYTPRCDWETVEAVCEQALAMKEELFAHRRATLHFQECPGCRTLIATGGSVTRHSCKEHAYLLNKACILMTKAMAEEEQIEAPQPADIAPSLREEFDAFTATVEDDLTRIREQIAELRRENEKLSKWICELENRK